MRRHLIFGPSVFLLAWASSARAERVVVQGPALGAVSKQRTGKLRAMRHQRIAPARHEGQRSWVNPETLQRLSAMDPRSAEYRQAISNEPLRARLEIFTHKANAAGYPVERFDRRLRGMLQEGRARTENETLLQVVATGGMGNKASELIREGMVHVYDEAARQRGYAIRQPSQTISPRAQVWVEKGKERFAIKRARVSSPSKTFFQVKPETFPLFKEIFGNNVVWFTVNRKPTHLYTILTDQAGGDRAQMIEYGVETKEAGVTAKHTQYALPVVLTDHEMDRLVRYIDAGSKAESESKGEKIRTFGFFAGRNKISNIACTNWASGAPIGELHRWVRQLDKRLIELASRGEIRVPDGVAQKGLHAALAAAEGRQARQEIVAAVLSNSLPKYLRRSAKKLLRTFERELDGNLPSSQELGALIDPLITELPRYDDRAVPRAKRSVAKDARNSLVALKNAFTAEGTDRSTLTDKLNQAVKQLKKVEAGFEDVSLGGAKALRQNAAQAAKKLDRYYTGMDRRPGDLVARKSLAEMLGIGRSQDPAKWSYDLLLNKRVPVVAVFNPSLLPEGKEEFQPFDSGLELQMEIMGKVSANGRVVGESFTSAHPNTGAVGELPRDPAAFGQAP